MDAPGRLLAVGVLAKRTSCKVETIRYYERLGLLRPPGRSPAGYRLYGVDDLKRLAFIRRARSLGFTLDEVRVLLTLADRRRRACAEAQHLAEHHLTDVRAKVAALRVMERVLTRMIARCADGTLPECPLIEALTEGPDGGATR